MTNTSTSFSLQKRGFLHTKLDEILRVWDRGLGKGSFFFSINNGLPDFQFGLQLDLLDVSGPTQPSQTGSAVPPPRPVRRRGPARRERDRQRAARHHAAQAAAAASADKVAKLPGVGRTVGSAARPSLPIPLENGAVSPPPPPLVSTLPPASTIPTLTTTNVATPSIVQPDPMVVPTMHVSAPVATTTASIASLPTMSVATSLLSPALVRVRDELHSESESEDDEQLTPGTRLMLSACALCHQPFTSTSGPGYCPQPVHGLPLCLAE